MPTLADLAAARAALADPAAALRRVQLDLATAEADLAAALGRGDRAAAEQQRLVVAGATSRREDLLGDLAGRRRQIEELAVGLFADPALAVATLAADAPAFLLPVRVETRFADGGTRLRVRVFPDQAHVTAHDPALTPAEVEGLTWYWTHRWPARDPATPEGLALAEQAWAELAGRFPPGRAAFVVRAYPPTNLAGDDAAPAFPELPTRASAWSAAARADLLPDRWCVLGFRREGEGRYVQQFRVWATNRVPDTLAVGPRPDLGAAAAAGGLPDDPELAWVHDYAAALAVGMAVEVTAADLAPGETLARGVDRLVVVGVDTTRAPADGAAELERHLAALAAEGSLGFVPAGTPTNSVGGARSGFSTARTAVRAQLAPHVPPATSDDSGAARLARALGVAAEPLAALPGGDLREGAWQGALVDALWAATGGYFLTEMLDPVADDPALERGLRDHAAAHLRPGGPLPTLRIGAQPYGVLPVQPRGGGAVRRRDPDPTTARIRRVAALFRELAEPLVDAVPRIGAVRTAADVDDVMLALLQRTPVAWSLTFRELVGPVQRRAMSVYWDAVAGFQRDVTATVFSRLGVYQLTQLSELTHDQHDHPLTVPWVLRPEPTATDPTATGTGYLAEIVELLRTAGGREVLEARQDAVALLDAYLSCAAVRELDRAIRTVIVPRPDLLVGSGLADVADYAVRLADRVPNTLRVEQVPRPPADPAAGDEPLPVTPFTVASTVVPAITGTRTLADHVIAEFVASGGVFDHGADDAASRLQRFTDALTVLQAAPADQLEWATRGVFDLYYTRLDAWITSLATARLGALRSGEATGVHLGGWGVVEDLRPDSARDPASESLGYVATPSLAQAASTAVMRAARLAHRDAGGRLFDLDLSSGRVRAALRVLEGVAAGQRLAALLGYRVERGLQERDLGLARWIPVLRTAFPLRSDRPDPGPQAEPLESVAARDVVDGVALLDRWQETGAAALTAAGVDAAAAGEVGAVLDAVWSTYDAVSDVLVAEAVHQTVSGNLDRAGAALAAHDRQERPPDIEVVRTPRDGVVVAHRVGVWFPRDATAPAPGWPVDLRSDAEPRLDRWLGTVLGPPAGWAVGAQVTTAAGEVASPAVDPAEMGLSATTTVLLARRPAAGGTSELGALLTAHHAGGRPDATVVLDADVLARLTDLATWAADVTGAAPLTGTDLTAPTDLAAGRADGSGPAAGVADLVEVTARATALADTVRARAADLEAAVAAGDDAAVRVALAALGPVLTAPDPSALTPAQRATAALARLAALREALGNLIDHPLPDAAEPSELVRARAVVRLLLGNDQPLLPVVTPAAGVGLAASLADRDALLAGDPAAPADWLQRSALVRPGLDPLAAVLAHREAGGADVAAELHVLGVPHRPGAPWSALPFGQAGPPPDGAVGVVLHAPEGVDPLAGGAGLLVDAWTETVPVATETTAVAFHYDAPGARAPQAALLALPADGADTWDLDMLVGCVHEAVDLARLRTLGSAEFAPFSTFLPALFLPENYTRDVPGIRWQEVLKAAADVRNGFGLLADHVAGKGDLASHLDTLGSLGKVGGSDG